jgi:hypothetical protein
MKLPAWIVETNAARLTAQKNLADAKARLETISNNYEMYFEIDIKTARLNVINCENVLKNL